MASRRRRRSLPVWAVLVLAVIAGAVWWFGPRTDDANRPAQTPNGYEVASIVRVVDGDTIVVRRHGVGDEETVRLVGIDTPETVHPSKPVQCFGPEASTWLTDFLAGQDVYLETDPAQGDTDRYDRLLRYVWLADGAAPASGGGLVNLLALEQGFARAYDGDHAKKVEFDRAEAAASQSRIGLWGACD